MSFFLDIIKIFIRNYESEKVFLKYFITIDQREVKEAKKHPLHKKRGGATIKKRLFVENNYSSLNVGIKPDRVHKKLLKDTKAGVRDNSRFAIFFNL